MSCLAWNCHGLGNLRIRRELVDIVRAKDPSVIFLVKTLIGDARLELFQRNINFDHRQVVLRQGKGGGLVLFWKSTINLEVEGSHQYYIDATIDKGTENEWQLTGFYGESETSKRRKAWEILRQLNSCQGVLWLSVGDFNEITKQDEKLGGGGPFDHIIRCNYFLMLSMNVIFIDLGYLGPKFTWSKHYESGHSIWERLDRGLATNNWFLKFLGSRVFHL